MLTRDVVIKSLIRTKNQEIWLIGGAARGLLVEQPGRAGVGRLPMTPPRFRFSARGGGRGGRAPRRKSQARARQGECTRDCALTAHSREAPRGNTHHVRENFCLPHPPPVPPPRPAQGGARSRGSLSAAKSSQHTGGVWLRVLHPTHPGVWCFFLKIKKVGF